MGIGPLPVHGWPLRTCMSEGSQLSFPKCQQLPMAPQLGLGTLWVPALPMLVMRLTCSCSGLGHDVTAVWVAWHHGCGRGMTSQLREWYDVTAVWVQACSVVMSHKYCFKVDVRASLTLTVFLPLLSWWTQSYGGGHIIQLSPLELSIPQSFVFCAWTSCGSMHWTTSTAKRNFSD